MGKGSSMQIIEPGANTKEEEVDQLMEEADLSELEEDDNPNKFRIHDPLPEYREYKRKLSELHSKSGFCIFSRVVTLILTGMIHAGEILLNPPYQRGICLVAVSFLR
jgi:hypothetical protein